MKKVIFALAVMVGFACNSMAPEVIDFCDNAVSECDRAMCDAALSGDELAENAIKNMCAPAYDEGRCAMKTVTKDGLEKFMHDVRNPNRYLSGGEVDNVEWLDICTQGVDGGIPGPDLQTVPDPRPELQLCAGCDLS